VFFIDDAYELVVDAHAREVGVLGGVVALRRRMATNSGPVSKNPQPSQMVWKRQSNSRGQVQ
jgi:hypothetical protein